jgi:nucleoid-associated protein YgaU
VTKTVQFNPAANKGGNVPNLESTGGDPRTITLELLFDSSMPRNGDGGKAVQEPDVRKDINKLFSFMLIDDQLKQSDGQNSKMGRPPQCQLQWARDTKNFFPCYISQCTANYLLFSGEGIPIRAKVTLQLKEATDPAKLGGTNPTSRGEPGRKARQVKEGDRLDWIAFQEYGDANEWRLIAEANSLYDPLNLRPGTFLAIPPR